MTSHIMSLRISEEMKARLDQLSAETKRPASAIAEEALADYLSQQEDERQALNAAVERADRGDFVSHDTVKDWLASWGTSTEKSAPQADIIKRRR